MYVLLTIGSIPAGLLGTLALLARRRRRQAGEPAGRSVTDELDNLEELEVHARAVAVAAKQAVAAADEAHHRAGHAVRVLDLAGSHYRQLRQQAQVPEHPLRLVERAAVNAYRHGQLSAAELNRIWQHTQATAGSGTHGADSMPVEWDSRMHAARQRYEQAAIEVTDVHKQAQVTTIAARVLAEEARAAEAHLTAAQRSTSTGLAALFLAE
ncbi:hypothetical protein DMB66_24255 [Actinoplanes sp. ATCC 53533]|uniref:hypothetical protein n=1 Tax=Actinoplanes sp. ATCC 53533 TaxID=1288362 RepID=UPI000F79385B|nr:hypothetical protein [Actinoplanes sp. ATCC 53533]RSM61635.1 hypothetical protein DMB66_24255 [Actinoplanes sp. ATCC 53533]